jgi:flagellar biosynthesis protein FlhB
VWFKLRRSSIIALLACLLSEFAFPQAATSETKVAPEALETPPLARTLYATVELDDEIPREHYKAVAEVIGYVMRMKKRAVY